MFQAANEYQVVKQHQVELERSARGDAPIFARVARLLRRF